MSFLALFGFGKKEATASVSRASRYYVVDAATLESPKGERIRLAPRQQIDLLRRLARFVKKEHIRMSVVFDGKPLNDAPDGKPYQDVTVHYAEKLEQAPSLIGKLCSAKRGLHTLVITSCRQTEGEAQKNGAVLMHSSTFRKALAENGEAVGGRADYGGPNRRRPRKPVRRPPPGQGGTNPRPVPQKPEERKGDGINEYLDLVD